MLVDTIAAISTPQATGGLGIIRISGPSAFTIADKIFFPKGNKKLSEANGYSASLGFVKDHTGETIDEVIALVFRSPKSYTGEDIVEFSCHGGLYILQRLLREIIFCGARQATPGEFTRRAYLNGKLDLTSAEAVMDLIGAQGEAAARAALSQHNGALFREISWVRKELIALSAHTAAWIDFPEEDVDELSPEILLNTLLKITDKLKKLVDTFEYGRAIFEGIDTVIAGRPNVGKSTLMNLLAGYDKSIVTDIPGTTRDIIEETVRLDGIVLHLSDTAGLRSSTEQVEQIGINRARERLKSAGLVLAVFDTSIPLDQEDYKLLDEIKERPAIAIINKSDLPPIINNEYICKHVKHIVYISAVNLTGIEDLIEQIKNLVGSGKLDFDSGIITTVRQQICVNRAKDALVETIEAIEQGITLDAIFVGIEDALIAMDELTGEKATEDTIDEVFKRFCVGK
jgi:tRNA modification GTPase